MMLGTKASNGVFSSFRVGAVLALYVALSVLVALPMQAQLATATINGTVTDSSGAVIPSAHVVLRNVATGMTFTTATNGTGNYVFQNLHPGSYTLRVSKQGFATTAQKPFTVYVNQTARFDFSLKLGGTTQEVSVSATALHLETSTASLGTAIATRKVNELPLNGRNFTQLLTLTPGVSPVSVTQNKGGGAMGRGVAIGTFTFPSVNGQTNRSNLFYLDGLNDQGSALATYNAAPIVDAIQEFKVESHNDQASFGGALGGIVSVVSKSGTNMFHGDAWEFVRNDAFDARNPFLANVVPFKQNQFGATAGGPVMLPKYNGKNKTFFFAAYEGYRRNSSAQGLHRTLTPQEFNGDLSDLPQQIYNPFSTRPDPNNSGSFIRDPFMCDSAGNPLAVSSSGTQAAGAPCNQIPSSLINQGLQGYGKAIFPSAEQTGIPGINNIDATPATIKQDIGQARIDEQINSKNLVWFRWTGYNAKFSQSGGFQGVLNQQFIHGYNAGISYTHTFGPSSVATFEFGRNYGQDNHLTNVIPANQSAWVQAGFAPNFTAFSSGNTFDPGISLPGFLSLGTSLQNATFSDIWEFKGDWSFIHGHHTFSAGADFATNNWTSPHDSSGVSFSSFQTSNPADPKTTGSPVASFLLNVPSSAGYRNVFENTSTGWVDGFYFQDQWRATRKLSINLGLRYDLTRMPIYGGPAGNGLVGDLNLSNGTYIVARPTPACSSTQGAPCIPGGQLPAHVIQNPNQNGAILNNSYDNLGPHIGFAYLLRRSLVLRASYGRFFDNWGADIQLAQNYEGSWPSVLQLNESNLNNPTPTSPTPTISALDPFSQGSSLAYPAATPFTQQNWFTDPSYQTPLADQWNFGLQQQIGQNTVVSANYVGAHGSRLDFGPFQNVAVAPGPGNPQQRSPYPYITPTYYDQSIGRSNYEAFQFSWDRKASHGLAYLVSYTWSRTFDLACDGWFAATCDIQNPYNLNGDAYGPAGFDLPQIFSVAFLYDLPFGKGQRFQTGNRVADYALGGWRLNGIGTFTSGTPYDVGVSGDIANTGNRPGGGRSFYERLNVVGDPNLSNPTVNEWFNTSAFDVPAAYTFGNQGRNGLRSNWFHNVDFSIMREFPITETTRLEFRFESFNALNSPTWGIPQSNINSPTFGQVLGTANIPRQLQFGLKLYF